MELTDILARLDEKISTSYPSLAATLRPPASDADLKAAQAEFGPLPAPLVKLYQWHDGQSDGGFELYPPLRFYSLEEAIAERRADLQCYKRLGFAVPSWVRQVFPIMCFEADWLCTFSDSVAHTHAPLFWRGAEEPEVEMLAPSLAEFFEFLIKLVEADSYYVEPDEYGGPGCFNLNETIENRIRAESFKLQDGIDGVTAFSSSSEYPDVFKSVLTSP